MSESSTVARSPGVPTQRGTVAPEDLPLYDFRRPLTLARDTSRRLEMGFERFARMWGTQLTSRLRVTCTVTHEGLTLHTYDDYVATLPNPTAMVLCLVEQTRQAAVIQMAVPGFLIWVDYLFGGTGMGDDRERELTDIELVVVRDLLQRALDDLAYSFASIVPLAVTIRSVQYNPQFVQATSASEAVVVSAFKLRVGEREDIATFMLPADLMLMEPAGEDVDADRLAEEARAQAVARDRLEQLAEQVPVEISVQFRPMPVRPSELIELTVGDIFPLRHSVNSPLDVVVDGVVLARAAAGSHGSRLACQVVAVEEESR